MIYVDYMYLSSKGDWKDGTQRFNHPYQALRFIWKVKKSPSMVLISYRCDNQDDYEYLAGKGV